MMTHATFNTIGEGKRGMNSPLFRILLIAMMGLMILKCSTVTQVKDDIHWLTLNQTAMEAYQKQDYEKAAGLFEKALSKNQDNFAAAYNLACCHALQGDAENAAKYLTVAFANGYRNIDWLNRDTDFDPVREEPAFKSALRKIEKQMKSLGERKYVAAKSMLPYRIRLPKDYDPAQTYPLIVGLHGGAGTAAGFATHYDKLEDPQIIYVTAEGQYPFSNNIGPMWYARTWDLRGVDPEVDLQADALVEAYILNTVKAVSFEHKVSQVYLAGFSQGAVYSYSIGMRNTDEIDGVIAFGGYVTDMEKGNGFLTKEQFDAGKDLRIFMAHGVKDGAVSIDKARELAKQLKASGYDVRLHEFEGEHNIPADVMNSAADWIES